MIKLKIYILSVIVIVSCTFSSKDVNISFFEDLTHTTIVEPILTIHCQYDECGEWGGHEEVIEINRNDYQDFTLKYVKYDINCDSMMNKFDGKGYVLEPLRTLNIVLNKKLRRSDKEVIYKFCAEMIKCKFQEPFPGGHSGKVLSVTNYDSTLHISTYGKDVNHYQELLQDLNL